MRLTNWLGELRRQFGSLRTSRKRRQVKRRQPGAFFPAVVEILEERVLLSGMSLLEESVAVGAGPIGVVAGLVNNDGHPDTVTLGADGWVTVSLNSGEGHWESVTSLDFGLGPAVGMTAGLLNADPLLDLAVQTPGGISILAGDGAGGFSITQTLTPAGPGELAAASGTVRPVLALLNNDFAADLAVPVPGTDEVLIFLGNGDGTLADPIRHSSGADQPVVIATADLIGDAFPDLAIGHADGTLTFLLGQGDGTFTLRPELSISGLGTMADVQAGDFNADGKADLIVSGGDRVTLLTADPDAQATSPLVNGDFSLGLTGWQAQAIGQTAPASAGRVNAMGGVAQLIENESFLVTLSQTFTVPDAAETLSFDVLSLGLEHAGGGIPDAFEVSLLDADGHPLALPFRPEATSFFNAAPDGTISLAAGVTFDGQTVTLDLSGLAAGIEATLYFDLIGHPPGSPSSVMLDNVLVTPGVVPTDSFTATLLEGPFANAAGLAVADVDGDGFQDVLVADAGANHLVVFRGDGMGGFTREEIDLSSFGNGPLAVATGPLTPGDSISDAAVVLNGSSVLVSPLGLNAVPVITPPANLAGLEGETVHLTATFTAPDVAEPFTASVDWGDGTTSTAAVTFSAGQGTVTASHVYADNGSYLLRLTVTNTLGESGEANLTAVVGNELPVMAALSDQSVVRTEVVDLAASFTDPGFGPSETFTALIDWGDGSVAPGNVVLTPGAAGQPTSGSLTATHAYETAGTFLVRVTVADDDGETTELSTVTVAPTVAEIVPVADVTGSEGQTVTLDGSFTAPDLAGPFTAFVFWGDGQTTDAAVTFANGQGTFTASHVYGDDGTFLVGIEVANHFGEVTTILATAVVSNVAPTLTAGPDREVDIDENLTFALASFTDPASGPENSETYTALVNWGDGSASEPASVTITLGINGQPTTGTISGERTYAVPGTYAVIVTLNDGDGGEVSTTLSITAVDPDVPPVLAGLGDLSLGEGELFTLSTTFTDENGLDGQLVSVDWGDGTTGEGLVSINGTIATLTADHAYANDGIYDLTLTVTDPTGLFDVATATATVGNVAPTLSAPADRRVLAGEEFTLAVAFTDPGFGPVETFTATIDWGDGTSETATVTLTEAGGIGQPTAGLVSATHTYAALGNYVATVTLMDDNGGTASQNVTLTAATKFFVVDQSEHAFFEYDPDIDLLAQHDLGQQNSSPRGMAADPTGELLWILDHSRRVFVYDRDGTLQGEWQASLMNAPSGIATDGTHLWIVGDAKDEVGYFENGAALRSGTHAPTSTFDLLPSHDKPTGLVTDGEVLWVTDEKSSLGRTFVYGLDGTPLGNWSLDAANGDPSGITLDPRTGDLWITDRHDGAVYQYADAADVRSGSLTATGTFLLDPANHNPEGIADPVALIQIGDVIGEGIQSGEVDEWQFTATADQTVFIDFQQLGGGTLRTTLTDPDGNVIYTDSSSSFNNLDNGPLTLDDGGIYTLAVEAVFSSQSPTYQFQIWDVPAADLGTLAVGDTVSGDIETPGTRDQWTFTVTDSLPGYLDFTTISGGTLAITLTKPDGSNLLTDSGSTVTSLDNPLDLSQVGTYTLTVRGSGDDTADYVFRLLDVTPVIEPLTLGAQVDGTTPGPGVKTAYTFEATSDQTLFLDWQGIFGATVEIMLYAPSGTLLLTDFEGFATNNLDHGPLPLTETGTYRLEVGGRTVGELPGYRFTLYDVPPPDVAALTFNAPLSGQIDTPGAIDDWIFTGESGQELFLHVLNLSGGSAVVSLLAPDGSEVFRRTGASVLNFLQGTTQLNQNGTYTLRFQGFGSAAPGYSFTLWDVPDPDLYDTSIGEAIEGRIDVPGARDEWRFDATADQPIFLDVQQLVDGGIHYELVRPGGSVFLSDEDFVLTNLDQGPITLDATGTWTLKVNGYLADAPDAYRIRLFDLTPTAAMPIVLGEIVSGAIDVPGRLREYTVEATAGETLALDVLHNPSGLFGPLAGWTLLAPDGGSVFTGRTSDHVVSLNQTGSYRLIVDQAGGQRTDTTTDFSFRVLAGSTIPAPPDAANLVVTDVTAPARVVAAEPSFTVSWTVTNTGPIAAEGGWIDRVQLSADGVFLRAFDVAFAEVPHTGPLAPGASYVATATVTLPPGFEGDVTAFVHGDALNAVHEAGQEADNVAGAQTLAVFTAPLEAGPPTIAFDQNDGDQFAAGEPVVLSGQVQAISETANVVFVLDLSSSTQSVLGLDANFDGLANAGDDLNGDGRVGDILDAEIGAVLRVVQNLRDTGVSARVSVIAFASQALPLDLDFRPWSQSFAAPDADQDEDGTFDVDGAVRALVVGDLPIGQGTNFMDAVAVTDALIARADAAERTQVLFLTDGESSVQVGNGVIESLAARGIEFHSFQITGTAVTNSLHVLTDAIAADPASTGDTTLVTDPNDLAAALLVAAEIATVTADGAAVDTLDAAGRFFTTVTLAVGPNVFTIAVTDTTGQTASRSITLVGVDPAAPADFSSLVDATLPTELVYSGTTFNRQTNTLYADARLVNHGPEPLEPGVLAVFERITPAAVTLDNPTGLHPDSQRPYVRFETSFGLDGLTTGESSDPLSLRFSNPDRWRFDLDVAFLAPPNAAPYFTSTPATTADVDVPLMELVTATDPNGDLLTFELLAGPEALTLNTTTGALAWTPAAANVGLHEIRYRVTDGRGGAVERVYQLFVGTPLADQSPLFITQPAMRLVTAGESFHYEPLALDPEGFQVTYTLETLADGLSFDQQTGELLYTPPTGTLGPRTVTLAARDPQGNVAFQSFILIVRGPNLPLTFSSAPPATATAGSVFRYDADAPDPDDAVTYSLVSPPPGAEIAPHTGVLIWQTPPIPGDYQLTVRATDERGQIADQIFTITLTPDETAPVVSILLTTTLLDPGETVTVQVVAEDNLLVTSLALTANGDPVALDAEGRATLSFADPGLVALSATATDAAGNLGTAGRSLRVIDPADTTGPIITITSPQPGAVVTYLTDIVGSITDDHLEFYELAYAPADSEQWTVFHRGTAEVIDGVLGTFDPTLLQNDAYDLRLTAQDVSGNVSHYQFPLFVEGHAKLGNFRLDFTDLTIPLAGIPITITRTYDTLQANEFGDFGYGWTLSLAEGRIRETVRQNPLEQQVGSLFGANPFRIGTRVYVNTPSGDRVGFTFDPQAEVGLLGTVFQPRFTPDPGVYERLEVENVPLRQNADGTFGLYFGGFNYNPDTYTLVTTDQVRYRYDQFDGLLDVTDRNGVTLTYTDAGIFSSTGESITWTRDALGRITHLTDPAGNVIAYQYDALGDLIQVTDQVGNATSLTYHPDRAHFLEEMTGPGCGCHADVRTEYDENGRVIAVHDALGNPVTYNYDLENNTETVADRLGNETRLTYDNRGNVTSTTDPTGSVVTYVYDENDNVISTTDPRGFTTTYTFDGQGNVTNVTDALDQTWTWTYNAFNDPLRVTDALGRVTENVYDANGNLMEVINPAGDSGFISVDSFGRAASITDVVGRTTTLNYQDNLTLPSLFTNPDGTTFTIEYNHFGEPVRLVDERGHETQYTYDSAGRLTTIEDARHGVTTYHYDEDVLVSMTDALGQITQYEYDNKDQLVRMIDPLSGEWTYHYDANGDLLTETDALGRVTSYAYGADRLLLSMTDALGGITSYVHDASGNVTSMTDANGHATDYAYDELDRLVRRTDARDGVQNYAYDAVGNLLAWTDERGTMTVFAYDVLDRLLTTMNTLGGVVTRTYDPLGNLTTWTDENNQTTTYGYDNRNRLIQQTNALGGQQHLAYDDAGNLIAWTDENNHVTEWAYDELNRLASRTDALDGIATMSYNAVGNQTSFTDELGRTTTYDYDPLDRLIEQTDPLGFTQTLTYDAVGNLLTYTDELGETTTSTYDALNRRLSTTDPLGAIVQFAYDALGNLISTTDPLLRTSTYAYDELNRLITATDPRDSVTAYAYDASGNLISLTDPLQQTTSYEYDLLHRLTKETDPLSHQTLYDYDAAGNLTELTDRNGRVRTFSYDVLNRQTAETWLDGTGGALQTMTYVYDAVGNLLSASDPGSGYYLGMEDSRIVCRLFSA